MMLIKLGGSAITDKSRPLTPRTEDIIRLTREIAEVPGDKIVVHGAGSFGHIKAAEYELKEGYKGERQREGVSLVQRDMRELNQMIVDAFHEVGVPVASIPAGAITTFDNGQMDKFPSDVFSHYVGLGITPITFGDVVVDKSMGIAICSGDDIILRLARDLGANKCVFATAVDGIFPHYPPKNGEGPLQTISPSDKVEFRNQDVDVTGSMERKLELMFEIATRDCDVYVLNGLVPGRLSDALKGNDFIGTKVKGE